MIKKYALLIIALAVLVILPLSACEFAFPLPKYLPAASLPQNNSGEAAPRTFDTEDNSGDDPSKWISGNPYQWSPLPASISSMSEEEMKNFIPAKLVDYFASGLVVRHNYSILSASLKDGVLSIVIDDDRWLYDANDAYQYLKKTFPLTDKQILAIPQFSDCVIADDYMFTSEDNYADRQSYASVSAWQHAMGGSINELDLGDITLPPIPVSENLKASVLDNYGNYANMKYTGFKNFVLNGRTESDFDKDGIGLIFMYFDYKDGQIIQIFEGTGEE